MRKILDKVFESLVALNKHMLCENIQRLEVQFTRTSNFYARKWGGKYFLSCYSGDCL